MHKIREPVIFPPSAKQVFPVEPFQKELHPRVGNLAEFSSPVDIE